MRREHRQIKPIALDPATRRKRYREHLYREAAPGSRGACPRGRPF